MKNNNPEFFDKVEYQDVLKEEIRNFLESENNEIENYNLKKNKYSKFRRTPLEIVNRLLFFLFIGSFLFSFYTVYFESKVWFVFYVISAFSCIFYTPNRKALKELIAAWPNVEDIIKGRSLWRNK